MTKLVPHQSSVDALVSTCWFVDRVIRPRNGSVPKAFRGNSAKKVSIKL